jgi:hypothetical protein
VSKMQNEREKDLIIEARFHRQLIGPKGENIQKIREEFEAVQISFPDLGSKSDVVKLRGPHDDVDKCGKQLTKLYKDLLENNYQVQINKYETASNFIQFSQNLTLECLLMIRSCKNFVKTGKFS